MHIFVVEKRINVIVLDETRSVFRSDLPESDPSGITIDSDLSGKMTRAKSTIGVISQPKCMKKCPSLTRIGKFPS